MLFTDTSYKTLVVGLLMIAAGFAAMYLENEVEGFISLYLSPLTILGGYGVVLYAIMRPDQSKSTESQPTA